MASKTVENLIKQFKKADLTLAERNALLTAILDKLQALPLQNAILIGADSITINGKQLDAEQYISFTTSAQVLKDNYAFKVFSEEIRYLAINIGVLKSLTFDELYFAKAALFNLDQFQKLLDKII